MCTACIFLIIICRLVAQRVCSSSTWVLDRLPFRYQNRMRMSEDRTYHLPIVSAPGSPHASICAVSHLFDDVIPAQKGNGSLTKRMVCCIHSTTTIN